MAASPADALAFAMQEARPGDGQAASPHQALVLEPDPLTRLLVAPAVEALGLCPLSACEAATEGLTAVFLPLTGQTDCRRACAAARAAGRGARPLVVGYGSGPPGPLAAHRAHRCADLVLLLAADAAGARFAHLPVADPVVEAGLTEREADVLVLLLAGLTTPAIARHLCISVSTARSHCRALLRKTGAGDRRALRARFLAGAPPASGHGLSTPSEADSTTCPGARGVVAPVAASRPAAAVSAAAHAAAAKLA